MLYVNQNKIVVKQYKNILTLETTCIQLIMPTYKLKIIGENFIVMYLSQNEMHICGKMKDVHFIYE